MTKHILIRANLSPFAVCLKQVRYERRFPQYTILLYRDRAKWLARKERAA